MRKITKSREPASLTKHRQTTHSDYDNYPNKEELRRALVQEQRGLCCYCMKGIVADGSEMKIEHWQCQKNYSELQLAYRNMLGACMGGHGLPEHLQHCDSRKAECDIKWNPADSNHRIEERIRYALDGTISSDDPEFDSQLNHVLGLNLPTLKNQRGGVIAALMDWWRSEKARLHGPVPRERLERERAKRAGDGTVILTPFDPVAVWWLDQRLRKSTT